MKPGERGAQLEGVARSFLEQAGLTLVSHNFRCRLGEIDLVMRDHDTLIFVEVRGRGSTRFGSPAETVTQAKQMRLIRAAQIFLRTHPEFADWPCRFDVVALATKQRSARAQWIKNAFDAN